MLTRLDCSGLKMIIPPYKEVDSHFGFKEGRCKNYSNKYNWRKIQSEYEEILKEQHLKDKEKAQRKTEKNIDKSNEVQFTYLNKRMEHLLYILGEYPNRQPPQKLKPDEEEKVRNELREIMKDLNRLQPLMRTNLHLTNNYNDKQENYNNTKIEADMNLNHSSKKSTQELLKEHEGEIGEFVRRAIKKQD